MTPPVFWNVADAVFDRFSGRLDGNALSPKEIVPVSAGVIPNNTRASSVRPAPTIPAKPTTSPARKSRFTS